MADCVFGAEDYERVEMSDMNLSDRDGRRINPAEVELQVEIRNKLERLLNGPGSDAHTYTTQKLVLDGLGLAQGLPESCKLIRFSHASQNSIYLSVNSDGDDATADDWLIPASECVDLPIVNADQVHIYGTAGDAVYLLSAK